MYQFLYIFLIFVFFLIIIIILYIFFLGGGGSFKMSVCTSSLINFYFACYPYPFSLFSYRSSIDIDNPVFEPDAIDLLHGMIKQVQAKIEELSDDEMFPIKLKLNNFTQELNVRCTFCYMYTVYVFFKLQWHLL